MQQVKIKNVLLVDDSKPTNFLHKKVISTTNEVQNIYTVYDGTEALDFLQKKGQFKEITEYPDIIFLDINMPKMNGFEFLEHYEKHNREQPIGALIVILTTSNWDSDKKKAMENSLVYDFLEKPLSKSKVLEVINAFEAKKVVL